MAFCDEVLRPYLECPDEQAADEILSGVLSDHAEPVVRAVLRRRLSGSAWAQDREDLNGEVILELLGRLRKVRVSADCGPIENFRAYVTTAAHHASDGFFRRRFPQRHRLKNRIRYVLRAEPRFGLWVDGNSTAVCGWARWEGQPAGELPNDRMPVGTAVPLEAALEMLFADTGNPLKLEDVVAFLADAWGIRDDEISLDSIGGLAGSVSDPLATLDNRRRLGDLWTGIGLLPLAQRQALLLHLRDESGGPVLALLPASGVASIPQIAQALEMPLAELAELWNKLPMPDSEIGSRLQVNRQQVINLRSAARQRLARRNGAGRGNIA